MGRVTVKIKVENVVDLGLVQRKQLLAKEVRSEELEALVDTGATLLCLPRAIIEKLAIFPIGTCKAETANGMVTRELFEAVRLTIMGRKCDVNVVEVSSDGSSLVGYIPLEALDFVVDPKAQKLIPNPKHHGEMVLDLY